MAAKLSQAVKNWVEQQKAQGHIICYTRDGHPYAVIRGGKETPVKVVKH